MTLVNECPLPESFDQIHPLHKAEIEKWVPQLKQTAFTIKRTIANHKRNFIGEVLDGAILIHEIIKSRQFSDVLKVLIEKSKMNAADLIFSEKAPAALMTEYPPGMTSPPPTVERQDDNGDEDEDDDDDE